MVEFDRSAFVAKFQEEAQDLLQRLNEGVITLESDPGNRELIDQMLRDAHTLKGSSRMVGLIEISDVAHRLEDIMVKVRDKEYAYEPEFSDLFFRALDAIVFLADHAGKPEAEAYDVSGLQAQLTALAATGETGGDVASAASPEEVSPDGALSEDDAAHDELTPAGDTLSEPQRVEREGEIKSKQQATIRIRTQQVDTLLNLVSEVVISQIKAEQRSHQMRAYVNEATDVWQHWVRLKSGLAAIQMEDQSILAGMAPEIAAVDDGVAALKRSLASFSKSYVEDVSRTTAVVSELQEHGMSLRMLPVATVFNAFPRAVRDLGKQYKKDVALVLEGVDTELDKKVLEEINDPLVHIMRNAVDHGLETVEERRSAGKPTQGTIRLAARQEGDHIVIEISDDGAGIDPDKVRAAAVRKGYLTESEAKSLSDREAVYLIFEAGFSTSAIITEISGRGVGMDVVREFIVDKLKGSLDVQTQMGKGTTFRLTIPLTLAIIRALMLRVGGQVFAMPTASIEETLRIDRGEVLKVEGREVIRRQRRTIPLVRLADILRVPSDEETGSKMAIAVIGFSGHRIGFIVDAFAGEQQIVIKNLGSHLKKVDNVAGVTILGAGEVVPILNVPDLTQNARMLSGALRAREKVAVEREGPRKVLICEDSFTTRELERSIFEAAGYDVDVAMDGAMGLDKLRSGLMVDAVVTDVQMPNMDGFELTRKIKGDPALKDIPVIIVTSLERDEEKAEGVEAGADAYITKSVFNQDTLLDTVERLMR